MLFRRAFLEGIQSGSITLAFRRWKRPTVREGGTLMTALGQLSITTVQPVELDSISAADSRKAGYPDLEELKEELAQRGAGQFYRIVLGALRPDPRIELRNTPATGDELSKLVDKLRRLDARATDGAWTQQVLEVISSNTGVRAGDLCELLDQERIPFKRNVRKLKAQGLTESLKTGYRLSLRGVALLDELRKSTG